MARALNANLELASIGEHGVDDWETPPTVDEWDIPLADEDVYDDDLFCWRCVDHKLNLAMKDAYGDKSPLTTITTLINQVCDILSPRLASFSHQNSITGS
jgi:hypothetical protein